MISILRERPISYVARSAAGATTARRAPESPTSRKQLLAQYGGRLICVRYRDDAQRKKRFKTVELVVAERDWTPPRPRSPTTRSSGYASPLPTWPSVTG